MAGFAIADADYTVNGKRPVYRFCDGVKSGALTIGYINCNVKEQKPEEPEIKPVEYSVTDGADSEITTGKDEEITIIINGELSMFVSVEVDGNLVDSKYYKVKSGSTIITFTTEYLNTLSVGKHTIKVSYTDGEATTSFTIKNIETDNNKPVASDSDNSNKNELQVSDDKPSTENAPHAGDTSNMLLWIILALVSTGCAILCIPKLKKVN